jgi:hypothetical protein
VHAEIHPEPTAEERQVLLAALAELDAPPEPTPDYRSAWRLAGLAEDAEEES